MIVVLIWKVQVRLDAAINASKSKESLINSYSISAIRLIEKLSEEGIAQCGEKFEPRNPDIFWFSEVIARLRRCRLRMLTIIIFYFYIYFYK
jgi:hypothetical protein